MSSSHGHRLSTTDEVQEKNYPDHSSVSGTGRCTGTVSEFEPRKWSCYADEILDNANFSASETEGCQAPRRELVG